MMPIISIHRGLDFRSGRPRRRPQGIEQLFANDPVPLMGLVFRVSLLGGGNPLLNRQRKLIYLFQQRARVLRFPDVVPKSRHAHPVQFAGLFRSHH